MSEWDGKLPRDTWYWLIRRRDKTRCMAFYSVMGGCWRVSDSIGRTTRMSESRVARLYEQGGRLLTPFDMEVVMLEGHGYYVPKGIKDEMERLRAGALAPSQAQSDGAA